MTADTIMMTRRDSKHRLGNKSLVNKDDPHPDEPGEEQADEGDRGGDNTFRVTGFVGWSNGVFHVVEFGVLLVSTRKARTYRDQPAVPS